MPSPVSGARIQTQSLLAVATAVRLQYASADATATAVMALHELLVGKETGRLPQPISELSHQLERCHILAAAVSSAVKLAGCLLHQICIMYNIHMLRAEDCL